MLKGCLDDISRGNISLSKGLEEAESQNDELSSHQNKVVDQAFTHIVPHVQKYVSKSAIFKSIEDKMGTGAFQSGNP